MDDFDRYLNEQMKDPDFKKEWDENEARYQLMMMVLRARNEEQLTQSELAERTGLRQSNISRIEKGQSMPSIATLAKEDRAGTWKAAGNPFCIVLRASKTPDLPFGKSGVSSMYP